MNKLLPNVQAFAEGLELSTIPEIRKNILHKIAAYIQLKVSKNEHADFNFICTHNSRRSQLCQVWAQSAAFYYEIDGFTAFSGGTEVTAFHSNAISVLEESGFQVMRKDKKSNPHYFILYSKEAGPIACFSKMYNDPLNSVNPFAAVMTCSEAESACPFIPEAEKRFSLMYNDPKIADGTVEEKDMYGKRNLQIATEMFYVFSKIKK